MIAHLYANNPHFVAGSTVGAPAAALISMDAILRHYTDAERIGLDFIADKTGSTVAAVQAQCTAAGIVVDSE